MTIGIDIYPYGLHSKFDFITYSLYLVITSTGRNGCVSVFELQNKTYRLVSWFTVLSDESGQPFEPTTVTFVKNKFYLLSKNFIITLPEINVLKKAFRGKKFNLRVEKITSTESGLLNDFCSQNDEFSNFYATDSSKTKVVIINAEGYCVQEFDNLYLKRPNKITTSKSGDIFVCDSDKILSFDRSKNFKCSIVYRNERPTKVLLDDDENLIALCTRNDVMRGTKSSSIKLMNKSGIVVSENLLHERATGQIGNWGTNLIEDFCISSGNIFTLMQDKTICVYDICENSVQLLSY